MCNIWDHLWLICGPCGWVFTASVAPVAGSPLCGSCGWVFTASVLALVLELKEASLSGIPCISSELEASQSPASFLHIDDDIVALQVTFADSLEAELWVNPCLGSRHLTVRRALRCASIMLPVHESQAGSPAASLEE